MEKMQTIVHYEIKNTTTQEFKREIIVIMKTGSNWLNIKPVKQWFW